MTHLSRFPKGSIGLVAWTAVMAVACTLGASHALAADSSKAKQANTTNSQSIEQAYLREFAFLEAEKHTLNQRVQALKVQQAKQETQAKSELMILQDQLLAASLSADRLQESLIGAQREADGAGESEEVLESLLVQISAALTKAGGALPESADQEKESTAADLKRVQLGFAAAIPLLRQAASVRREKGSYFAQDGRRVEGDIVRVGEVAAYGLAPGATGLLAPAGAGRLKLWKSAPGKRTAEAWIGGAVPSRLSLFLFDSLEKSVDRRAIKGVLDVIESGGLIGWVIVVGGAVALILAAVRGLLLLGNSANSRQLLADIQPLLKRRLWREAQSSAGKSRGALGRVLNATLGNLDKPREQLEDIVDEAVLNEQPKLERFGNAIFIVAAVAPLLGLLGTVTGMIATFDIITEFGTGNPKLLSGGISIALVTTELGLVVAIPALVLGNLLNSWSESIRDSLDSSALRVVNMSRGVEMLESRTPPPTTPTSLPETPMVTA